MSSQVLLNSRARDRLACVLRETGEYFKLARRQGDMGVTIVQAAARPIQDDAADGMGARLARCLATIGQCFESQQELVLR